MTAFLKTLNSASTQAWPLADGALVTLGRDQGCQIRIEDDSLAATHCQIERRGRRWLLTSLDEQNKTRVNEEIVATRTLCDGDRILLGELELTFECSDARAISGTLPAAIAPQPSRRSMAVPAEEFLSDSRVLLSRRIDDIESLSSSISSRHREHETIKRLRSALDTIYSLSSEVLSEIEEEDLYESLLEAVMDSLAPDRAHVLIWNSQKSRAEQVATKRSTTCPVALTGFPSQEMVQTAIQKEVAILSADASEDPRFQASSSVRKLGIHSAICVPIISAGRKIGAICVDQLSPLRRFQEYELELLAAVAHLAGHALERARMHDEMENLFYSCIRALVSAIETKDRYTHGHSERVASMAVKLAEAIGVDEKTLDDVRLGALLHDIGKIGVPEHILTKPSRLTDEEYEIIKSHPAHGAEILSHIAGLHDVIGAVRWHHEKVSGGGYPDNLAGQDIPLAARIVAVADAFDAMTSDRAYRDNLSVEDAISEFQKGAGTQFDAEIVQAMVALLREGKIVPHAEACDEIDQRTLEILKRNTA